MKPTELVGLLQAFYRDTLALRMRHEAGARLVSGYEANNAYQYVIAREDTQLSWLRHAIETVGGQVPEAADPLPLPAGRRGDGGLAVMRDDAERAGAFVDGWQDKVAALTHARHRDMLRVILGEMIEHRRLLEQARDGRTDMLGRRPAGAGTRGRVLPTRWVE